MAGRNRAAVLYGPRDIRIEHRDTPVPGDGEVLVRSTDVCVCATEVKYWYHGMPDVLPGTRVVQGHELGGIVEDVGENVKGNIIGSKVAIDPSLWCGVCDMCRAGMANLCRKLQFMSLPPVDGGFQQFYKVSEKNVHPVPEEMPSEWIPLVEPLSIGINAVSSAERISSSLSGKTVVIVGAGSQGLLLMQALTVRRGPRKICVLEPLDYRRKLAEDLGADMVLDPLDNINEMTDGAGADVVFEGAGESEAYQLAATSVKPGGTVVIVGIPVEQRHIPIQAVTARRAGLTLTFVRRFNPLDFPKAIDMIASGKVKVDRLITHFFSLDEITRAFELLHAYSDGVVKAIIRPQL